MIGYGGILIHDRVDRADIPDGTYQNYYSLRIAHRFPSLPAFLAKGLSQFKAVNAKRTARIGRTFPQATNITSQVSGGVNYLKERVSRNGRYLRPRPERKFSRATDVLGNQRHQRFSFLALL